MSAINDGGPAFPGEKNERFGQPNDCNPGMSLRDYFAAKALCGYLAAPDLKIGTFAGVAEHCYKAADAMLNERDKGKA